MNKWTMAAKRRKAEIDEAEEQANDLKILLDAMPPGQRKKLLEDEVCGIVLRKYGITE